MSDRNLSSVNSSNKKRHRILFIVAVNVLIFMGLMAALEQVFQVAESRDPLKSNNEHHALRFFWAMYKPFVMFTTTPLQKRMFVNLYKGGPGGETFEAEFKLNSDGFLMDHDLDFSQSHPKAANERFVFFTGGSAAWGAGATSDRTTVPARMEYYLNRDQTTYKYRVFNFGMGSWIAFQEFIALAYWGRSYAADWVVTMDGVNDGTLVCGEAKGAGRPMHNDSMDAYITAYLFGQTKPDFFRGQMEDFVLRHSSLYRGITGKSPLNIPLNIEYLIGSTPASRNNVMRDVKWIEVDRQRSFYVETQRQIANLFPKANVIMSTQPMVNQFRGHFMNLYDYQFASPEREKATQALESALRAVYDVMKDKQCGDALKGENFGYFLASIAIGTERLAESLSTAHRPVMYENMGRFFEDDFESRKQYFIDPVHMSDKGMDILGQQYARMILSKDLRNAMPLGDAASKAN